MTVERMSSYIKHIDRIGTDMVAETVEEDKHLTEDEKAAVLAYIAVKSPPARRRKKSE
jgi:hypothetical protein